MRNLELKNRRPYISHSQYALFKKDPDEYKRVYLYGEPQFKSDQLLLGKEVALGLEADETNDIEIETLRILLPTYPEKEYKIETTIEGVPMLGRLDQFDRKRLAIGEIKTGKKWTQQMADKSDQLKFYNLLVWGEYGRMANSIELYWIPTEIDKEGDIKISAKMFRTFRVEHKMSDLYKHFSNVKKVWEEINKMWDKEIGK